MPEDATNGQSGAGAPEGTQTGGDGAGNAQTFESWDEYLAVQDETVKGLYEGNVRGLKSALDSERTTRRDLETRIRSLSDKAEKGSELEKELNSLQDVVTEGETRLKFYEAAHAAGIRNLRLGYRIAVEDGLIDRRGNIDFHQMQEAYPELFGGKAAPPPGNAGAGTGAGAPKKNTMNDFIRSAAGRG